MEDPVGSRLSMPKTNQNQGDKPNGKRPTQPNIPPEVRQWMQETYVKGEGEIDRAEMHNRYRAFCESRGIPPKDLANFGKIVKNLFPDAGYRRLGSRGTSSVSHYAGIVLRNGDPSRAVKSQRKPSSKARHAARQTEEQTPQPICFVMETPQSLAVSKKRPALQGEKGEEEEEEEASDYDEDDYSDDDEEEEEGELAGLPVISSQRHKRLQVRTHRDFRMCLNSGQSMNLMTVIREYRDMYRNELWGLTPTNPASMKSPLIKYILLDEEGKKERSSLSFSCLLMLCVASFLNGDWGYSRSFYNLAREHLSAIDSKEYDVAAGLVAFGWWVTFYAHTAEEGKRTQLEHVRQGLDICHHLKAYNDEVHWLLLSLESANTTQKKVELIEASKKLPPYNRGWKNFRNLKRPASMEWADNFRQVNVMFQYVLSSVSVMRSKEQTEEKKERTRTLYAQLNKSVELERGLKNAMHSNHRPSMQTFNMLMTFNYSLRAMTCNLLGLSKDVKAAEDLINFLLGVPAPMMLISIHGISSQCDYVLVKNAVDVLVGAGKLKPLRMLLQRIEDSKIQEPFYWLTYICTYIESKLNAPRTSAPVATSPPFAAPHASFPPHYGHSSSGSSSPSSSSYSSPPIPSGPVYGRPAQHHRQALVAPAHEPFGYSGQNRDDIPHARHNPYQHLPHMRHHPDHEYQGRAQERHWSHVPEPPQVGSRLAYGTISPPLANSSPTYPTPPSNADSPATSPVRFDAAPTSPPFGVKGFVPMPAPLPMTSTFSSYRSSDRDHQSSGFEWSSQIVGSSPPSARPPSQRHQHSALPASTLLGPSPVRASTSATTSVSAPMVGFPEMPWMESAVRGGGYGGHRQPHAPVPPQHNYQHQHQHRQLPPQLPPDYPHVHQHMHLTAPSPADFHELSAVADPGLLQYELELLSCPNDYSFAEDVRAPLEHGLRFNNNISSNNNNIRPPGPPNWQPNYRA